MQEGALFEEYLEETFQYNGPTISNYLRRKRTTEEEDIRLVTPGEVAEETKKNLNKMILSQEHS